MWMATDHGERARNSRQTWREQAARLLRYLIEAVVIAMICFAPWAYGSIHTGFEFVLDMGVALLMALWGLRILCQGKLTWQKCPVGLTLTGLFLLGLWQTTPLPRGLLATISPATADWYAELLPAAPEQLPFDTPRTEHADSVGATISMYPFATRRFLQRLLAVLLVFFVVRNNLTSPASYRRLAIAVFANGAALSFFGIIQFFSSPKDLLYWSVQSMGTQVFGPFIYRNHFACYINLCIGMGLGLLWSRRHSLLRGESLKHDAHWATAPASFRFGLAGRTVTYVVARLRSGLELLHDPASLWICVGLALMMSSVVFTLSRGGFLALIAGFVVCAIVQFASKGGMMRGGAVLVSAALAVGLLGWFGLARVEARYGSLWGGTALNETRLPLWSAGANVAKAFPIWGCGLGAYQVVDPLYRTNAEAADLTVDHLHNDHLEMLAEGGLLGMGLTWLALGLIFSLGVRAVRQHNAMSGIVLGSLFSIGALAFHCLGDFCVSLPAIMLLAIVICARICGASSTPAKGADDPGAYTLRWHGLASLLAAPCLIILGWLVMNGGLIRHQALTIRQAVYEQNAKRDVESLSQKVSRLQEAAQLLPDDADLRTELADSCADLYRARQDRLHFTRTVMGYAGVVGSSSGIGSLPALALAFHPPTGTEEQRLVRDYLTPSLNYYVRARDGAPVLPGPNLGLAIYADRLMAGDSAETYRRRVQNLAPADPTFWYYSGNQELHLGNPQKAWQSWRRSLELSDRYLSPILERSRKFLPSEGLIESVLPDQPELIVDAAAKLFPRPAPLENQRPFLQRALTLLDAQRAPLTARDLRTKAFALQGLGRTTEAVEMYRALLQREPMQCLWRLELAQVLYRDGRLEDTRIEVETVLAQQRTNARAYELWTKVMKDLTQRR